MAANDDLVLQAHRVSKTFPGQKALDGVDLDIRRGEVHALLGENGSGKSTLIRILAGYHSPDAGTLVDVNGEVLTFGSPSASFDAGLRFVHQHLAIFPRFNAVENIALEAGYARPGRIDWQRQAEVAEQLLARLEVEMDIWKPLDECRAVERSAVAIARALRAGKNGVSVVVLDEPTASLPPAEVRQLFRLIRQLSEAGVATLYVSHRLDEVFEISDRVSVLRDGIKRGTVEVEGLSRAMLVEMIVGHAVASSPMVNPSASSARPESMPALKVDGLTAGRLSGLSFSVYPGEILGVAGITGSGREEFARTMVGTPPATEGTIAIRGQMLNRVTPDAALDAGLALAPSNTQAGSAIREFTVRENMSLASLPTISSAAGRISRDLDREHANQWMRALDVRPLDSEHLYSELSGGNQQKVILGKWLSASPAVLVLDEPTAGVDVGARRAIYELLADRASEGLAIVLCSSDVEDIASVCTRAIVIRDGRVAAELQEAELEERTLLLAIAGAEGAGSSELRGDQTHEPTGWSTR